MTTRPLGRTGLHASPIALGTVELGLDYGIPTAGDHRAPDFPVAERLLARALDLGVNLIDTARAYGASEDIIGRALAHRRDAYILCTKLTPIGHDDLRDPQLESRLEDSLHQSLTRLRTDRIDILQIHSASAHLLRQGDPVFTFLDGARARGQARFTGVSVYDDGAAEALRTGHFDCLQIAWSALDRRPETHLIPAAVQKNIGLIVRSVLLKGVLTPRLDHLAAQLAPLQTAARKLRDIAASAGITLPELAYRYVLDSNVIALCGTARIQELETTVAYAECGPLPADMLAAIRAVTVEDERLLNPGYWPYP